MKVNPVIYLLAEEFADQVRALAIIESNEDDCAVGDGGQAFGLLQQHPAFVKNYSRWTNINVHDTWAEAQVKMAAAFFRIHPDVDIELLVQAYNLGIYAVFTEVPPKRNPHYLNRWKVALEQIQKKTVTS